MNCVHDGDDSRDCAEIVTFFLSSTVSEILPNAGFVRPHPIFPHPIPIPAKIWECSFGVSVMLGSAERRRARLISSENIFQ